MPRVVIERTRSVRPKAQQRAIAAATESLRQVMAACFSASPEELAALRPAILEAQEQLRNAKRLRRFIDRVVERATRRRVKR